MVAAPRDVIEIDEVLDVSTRGGSGQRVESREQRALGLGLFDDRFDDVVGVGEGVERRGRHDTGQGRVAGRCSEFSLLDQPCEALFDRVPRAIEHRLRDVDQPHGEARLREHLGDAVAHRAGAHDTDRLDHRSQLSALLSSVPVESDHS